MKRVAILHYAAPPTVGGVEQTIYYHALELAQAGYAVRILAGVGEPFDPRIEVRIVPEFGSRQREVLAVKRQLDRGQVTADFAALRDRVFDLLSGALTGTDALIAHNVFTLHKNLPLTAALYELATRQDHLTARLSDHLTILAWHHDLAWDDPRYKGDVHAGQPWDLLRSPWPHVRHVTVSATQRARLAALYGIPPEHISVVSPGVDVARFFRWTESTRRLVETLNLLEADLLLLLPARLTRRKNVEMALRILAAMRASSGRDARLIVTGPPGAHNPANIAYLQHLLDLRLELDLRDAAHFLYQLDLCPDDDTMADLYQLADALLFPSAKEGFGIPILEAGLARLPVFCSDILPLRESGQEQIHTFSLDTRPEDVAELIWGKLKTERATILRRRVLAEYLWPSIVRHKLVPLLEGGSEK